MVALSYRLLTVPLLVLICHDVHLDLTWLFRRKADLGAHARPDDSPAKGFACSDPGQPVLLILMPKMQAQSSLNACFHAQAD